MEERSREILQSSYGKRSSSPLQIDYSNKFLIKGPLLKRAFLCP
jgi:hypothetical protein